MRFFACIFLALGGVLSFDLLATETNRVADLGTIHVEASALSKYRPETVSGGTFTGEAPESLPCVVETLTEDFIREKNPTDMNDLLRQVPGVETGGTSLLVRQPGCFSIRGMGGTEPAFDGVVPVGRGAGLFMDPAMMERVEIVKGPIASLAGGAGAQQNANGAGGSINMHLKGAHLRESEILFSEQTSVGRNIWRQRGMIDANEIVIDDTLSIRIPASFDFYSPAYISNGSQDGARPREQWTIAPSILFKVTDAVTLGFKTMFVWSDSPSYIGVPVWRGKPAGGYGWYESSCRPFDRSKYKGFYLNPYVDWQVTEDWFLKLGGAFMYSDWEQTSREPYVPSKQSRINPTGLSAAEYERVMNHFYETGEWLTGEKYMTSSFSESRAIQRNFNLYVRSVWTKKDLPLGFRNTFLVQPDFYYRDGGAFGAAVSRYGVTLQDSVGWGCFTLLAGIRYDTFVENASIVTSTSKGKTTTTVYDEAHAFAFSPRGGLTIQPFDGFVLFGNVSETRTPNLGLVSADGTRPTDPWVATQWEAGFRVRPLEKLWLSASYFDINQKNMPQADDAGYYYFDGHHSSHGAEFSVSGDLTENWTALALYAYTLYTDHNTQGKGGTFARTPRHAFTLNTSYRLHGFDVIDDIVVGLGYRFRSMSYATMRGKYVNENLKFDPSHVFDVSASIPLSKFGGRDNWFLTLGVRNLFGEKYFDTSRHFYEAFVGDPRTFEIGLRGKF